MTTERRIRPTGRYVALAIVFATAPSWLAHAATWPSPVTVTGQPSWRAAAIVVSPGQNPDAFPHACAVTSDGGVKCTGHLGNGQGGFGGLVNQAIYPIDMRLIAGTKARVDQSQGPTIAIGSLRNTCVLYDEAPSGAPVGGVQCAGNNDFGQLGDGTTTARLLPVHVEVNGSNARLTGASALVGGAFDVAQGHYCALRNGGVYCWGLGVYGQLGDGTMVSRSRAVVAIAEGSGVTQIAAGGGHSCAVFNGGPSGTVKCWGSNVSGQIGNASTVDQRTPATVVAAGGNPLTGVVAVTAGALHTCARMADGTALCWGHDFQGQLGTGGLGGADRPRADGPRVLSDDGGTLGGIVALSAGGRHVCAVVAGGELRCWGSGSSGQLGNGTFENRGEAAAVLHVGQPPGSLAHLRGIAAVAGGSATSCAMGSDGTVLCWGHNGSGVYGNGGFDFSPTPTYMNGAGPAMWSNATVQVSSRRDNANVHGCAATTAGELRCWGHSFDGQAGPHGVSSSEVPSVVPLDAIDAGPNAVVAPIAAPIAASNSHTCVVFNSDTIQGGVQCFGNNSRGQLGTGDTVPAPGLRRLVRAGAGPATNGYLSGVTHISASGHEDGGGFFDRTCAVANGGVFCWGGRAGMPANGAPGPDVAVPTLIMGTANRIAEVSVGGAHACALFGPSAPALVAGQVVCWGLNSENQLGRSAAENAFRQPDNSVLAPSPLPGGFLRSVVHVSAGAFHSCFLTTAGAVFCAGFGGQGERGDGATTGVVARTVPAQAPMNGGVTAITTGNRFTCAVRDGQPYCVGKNSEGQLGRATFTGHETAWGNVVAPGGAFVSGQPALAPLGGLDAGPDVVSAGSFTACARQSTGVAYCWGHESVGQLGDGSVAPACADGAVGDITDACGTCGNGAREGAEDCDHGAANGTTASCCADDCTLRAAGAVCRAAADLCDGVEVCDGASSFCPTIAGSTNLALNKPATQSSTAFGGEASRAVDGNTDGVYGNGSVTHTNAEPQAFWQVDLGSVHTINDVRVWNRAEFPERVREFFVFVSDAPFASDSVEDLWLQPDVSGFFEPGQAGRPSTIPVRRSGRFVRIQLAGTNFLHLAEVQVIAGTDALRPAGAVCRSGGGPPCDLDEVCSGTTRTCPSDDAPANSGDVCHIGSGDVCDPAVRCNGEPGVACPPPAVKDAAFVCRAGSGDLCDPPETCTGVPGEGCPGNVFAPATTLCRAGSGDTCDQSERCPGVAGGGCPPDDAPSRAGTVCRPGSGDVCDRNEVCTGFSGQRCPDDDVSSNHTVVCRASSEGGPSSSDGSFLCDAPETCGGLRACPPDDRPGNVNRVCRPGSGDLCDPEERCRANVDGCPPDVVLPPTTVCRTGSGDVCDPTELCSGVPKSPCAPDVVKAEGTVCRAADEECDSAEQCSGRPGDRCPADVVAATGAPCSQDGNPCTEERCDGAGTCTVSGPVECDDGDLCTIDTCDPELGCLGSGAPGTDCTVAVSGSFDLRDAPGDDRLDALKFKWKGGPVLLADLGNPTQSTDYALCVYDAAGVRMSVDVPARGRWKAVGSPALPRGFKFSDSAGVSDGVTAVQLQPSNLTRAKLALKGKGFALPDTVLPFLLPVHAQLRASDGACWDLPLAVGDTKVNDQQRYKAAKSGR